MKRGDLVLYLDRHWIVCMYDPKRTRLSTLLASDGSQVEVPHDLDKVGGVVVLSNPADQWPYVILPEKNGYTVSTIAFNGDLIEPITGWVASDPTRSGGPVFLAPNPRLRYGEIIIVTYRHTGKKPISVIRVDIPRDFGTVRQRLAKAEAKRPKLEEKNAFTRLLDDKQIGDDD